MMNLIRENAASQPCCGRFICSLVALLLSGNPALHSENTAELIKKYGLDAEMVRKINREYSPKKYFAYIKKSCYKLFVFDADGELRAVYPIALGKRTGRKTHQGDRKTPEGIYHITTIYSADAPVSSKSYQTLKWMNAVEFKAADGHSRWGHPEQDAGVNNYGPRFMRINYPNQADRERYEKLKAKDQIAKNKKGEYFKIGGNSGSSSIAIHGTNDPPSIGHNSSNGCIRLLNEDVIKLDGFLEVGTVVYIEK